MLTSRSCIQSHVSLVVLQVHLAAADEALVKLSPSKTHPVSCVMCHALLLLNRRLQPLLAMLLLITYCTVDSQRRVQL